MYGAVRVRFLPNNFRDVANCDGVNVIRGCGPHTGAIFSMAHRVVFRSFTAARAAYCCQTGNGFRLVTGASH